jgi:hypothetical protein
MSALTPQIVGEVMRKRMGTSIDSARFIAGIPEALKATGRKVAADPYLRPILTTNPAVVQPTINTGSVPLNDAALTGAGVLTEYLDYGRIYHVNYPNLALRRISPTCKMIKQPWEDYGYYYVEDASIYPIDKDNNSLSGQLLMAVPYYPLLLAYLPDELQPVFFDKLEEWLAETPQDAAEDGKK